MTMPPPSNRRFDADELIAVVVALAAIGGILFWGLRRVDPTLSWNMLGETDTTSDIDADSRLPFQFDPTPGERVSPSPASPSPTAVEEEDVQSRRSAVAPVPAPTITSVTPLEPETSPDNSSALESGEGTPESETTASSEGSFPDVSTDYWAYPFVAGLVAEGMLEGLQDGTFQPDAPTTRAQFASALQDAFELGEYQESPPFSDVTSDYWASDAIEAAVESTFMSGYPDDTFKPNQAITRLELMLALFSGLQLPPPENPEETLSVYPDASEIPEYAIPAIAAATEANLVVMPPGQTQFQPDTVATRSEVAASLYQALAFQGKVEELDSEAIVKP